MKVGNMSNSKHTFHTQTQQHTSTGVTRAPHLLIFFMQEREMTPFHFGNFSYIGIWEKNIPEERTARGRGPRPGHVLQVGGEMEWLEWLACLGQRVGREEGEIRSEP